MSKTVNHDTYEPIQISKGSHGVSKRCIGGGLRLMATATSEGDAKEVARLMTLGSAMEAAGSALPSDKKKKK